MDFNLGYTVTGFVVGLLVGLTGVGGGSLMTPMLVFAFNVPTAIAIGTDLLFAAITKTAGIIVHHRHSTIHWKVVGLMLLGSVPATLLTLQFLKSGMVQGKDYKVLLNTMLGVALVLTAAVLFFRNPLLAASHRHISKLPGWVIALRGPLTVVFGALLGTLVTLSSIGAGALGAAVLTFLYPRMAAIRIAGTDIAHAVPLTAIAGMGHYNLGNVDTTLLIALLIGSLPGIYLGSRLGVKISDSITRPILATAILLIGIKFLVT
ncbi:MAG: sulfite exporter TauE/SafE family protein [Pseudomonadota bacterium]